MAEPNLYNRVRFMREAAAIERCHKRPHLLRYSVGHHTHDVLSLLIQCWMRDHEGQLPRAELMTAAHIHDHPERVTGDLDSVIKALVSSTLERVENNVERWLGLDVLDLTDEEKAYLHAADKFECYLWVTEESRRGNVSFEDWNEGSWRKWQENPLPPAFMELLDEVGRVHMRIVTNADMLIIGGLS